MSNPAREQLDVHQRDAAAYRGDDAPGSGAVEFGRKGDAKFGSKGTKRSQAIATAAANGDEEKKGTVSGEENIAADVIVIVFGNSSNNSSDVSRSSNGGNISDGSNVSNVSNVSRNSSSRNSSSSSSNSNSNSSTCSTCSTCSDSNNCNTTVRNSIGARAAGSRDHVYRHEPSLALVPRPV